LKRRRLESLVLPAMAAVVLLTDQVSKSLVRQWLEVGESAAPISWLSRVFRLTHVTNTGAAFGMFPQLANVYVGVAAVVVLVIVLYYRHIPEGEWLVRVALGLALGGALGNLIDRLSIGHVIDFIDLSFWPLEEFAVFNVADSCITLGCALLLLGMVREELQQRRSQRAAEAA
jgi:signal peptidase II